MEGQLLASRSMFLHLHHHLHCKKNSSLLKSWGMEKVNFWLSVLCFYIFTITPRTKNIQICWNLGAWKRSTFGSAYYVFTFTLYPLWQKISKFAKIFGHGIGYHPHGKKTSKFSEILGHGKVQLLAQQTMFLCLQYHPHGKKYPNLLKSWGLERFNFWLSVKWFYVFTITPSTKKNNQFFWNVGAWKSSTFGSVNNVFMSSISPPWQKISKFA